MHLLVGNAWYRLPWFQLHYDNLSFILWISLGTNDRVRVEQTYVRICYQEVHQFGSALLSVGPPRSNGRPLIVCLPRMHAPGTKLSAILLCFLPWRRRNPGAQWYRPSSATRSSPGMCISGCTAAQFRAGYDFCLGDITRTPFDVGPGI